MRHGATLKHRPPARRKKHAAAVAPGLLRPFIFIVTAIIAAGVAAALIKTYQGELAKIWAPQSAIVAPSFGVIATPHDDICTNVVDHLIGTQNIKGLSEHGKFETDCIARQMRDDVLPP
jgi:hypothetical protein